MKSPWFILELQCYDPSALAPTPLDKMDKVDYLPSLLFFFTSLKVTGLYPFYVSSVDRLWVVLLSPCFSPLSQPLILSSVSDKQTLKHIHRLSLRLPA